MTRTFKVEMRTDCKECGGDLPNSRYRTYCGDKCRKKFYNKENAEKSIKWQKKRRAKNKQL